MCPFLFYPLSLALVGWWDTTTALAGVCENSKDPTTTTTPPHATITGVAKAALAGVLIGVVAACAIAIGLAVMIWRGRRGHTQLVDFAVDSTYGEYAPLSQDLLSEHGPK